MKQSRFSSEAKANWIVYLIKTTSGKIYTGITNNLARRFNEHREKIKGARFFRFSLPERVIFQESHCSRSEALKREISIKKMTRKEKEDLVAESAGKS